MYNKNIQLIKPLQESLNEDNRERVLDMNLEARMKSYHYNIVRLQRMVEEKVKEVEQITAEKEELESNVQNALQKLWAKEAELHNHRESSSEREKRLLNSLRQESAHSDELEIQIQSLTNQNDMLQEQVFQLEQQLSMVKGETEKLDRKLPELENTNDSLKKMTVGLMGQIVDVMSVQNKRKPRAVDLSSSTSTEETNSDPSRSEQYNDSEESAQDDLSEEVKAINLRQQNQDLRNEMKNVTSSIEELWQKITALDGCKAYDKERFTPKEPKALLRDIYEVHFSEKSKATDLEEQNDRHIKHLQEVQEKLCLTEGRIQKIWVSVSLYEEKDENFQRTCSVEETENALQKIESILSRNKATLQENQELKRFNASHEKKISDLKGLVAKTREEGREILKELEIKSARFEELRLSTNKTIEDKEVEIEILKEQLQEMEKKEEHGRVGNCDPETGAKCPDGMLEKLLRSRERDLETYKKKYEKVESALGDEIRDLQETLERVTGDKNDLQEYCDILKEALETSELGMNAAAEKENSLQDSLEEAKKREAKLFLAARELYDELQIQRNEASSQETTSAALYEKVKCLEMEIQTNEHERQVDKKNLKNARETEQYLQSSLQQALAELFELKAKKENAPEESEDQPPVELQDEHRVSLVDHLQELESIIHSAMEKSVQDLQNYAERIDGLCEENKGLKKEVNECKTASNTLRKTNLKLKTLLQAVKDDLLDELKAKKELEVLIAKSNDKTESSQPEYKYNQGFDEQSTSSQLPDIKEAGMSGNAFASPSDICLQDQKKTGKVKESGKRKLIPKAISKRFSSSSVDYTAPRTEKKDKSIQVSTDMQTSLRIIDKGPRNEKSEKLETVKREQRLRNILMTVQHDKEGLEEEVESLSDELQRTKAQLQNYENLNDSFREEANRNVCETLEIKKVLEVIYGKTKRVHGLINKDIRSLLEVSKANNKQMKKFELFSEQYEKENTELQKQAATLKEKLENEVNLKEAALEEARQLKISFQNVFESKEKCLIQSEPPLLISNLNTDLILPQMGKDEVRSILKEILQEIENSNSEEINMLKQRSAEQMEELGIIRQENKNLRSLVDGGVHEELQKAEERISYLNGQLKLTKERQNVLRESSIEDKIKANEEVERMYERYAELKLTVKSKEEALERYKEMEEVLMNENTQLHEEIESFKERFGADCLLPITEKAETKRAMEGWKRKCQRLEENFEKEKSLFKEENIWLHKQLAEESSLCTELRRCKAELEDSLEKAEEKIKTMHRKLEERQDALAGLEERRVILETKVSCLQKMTDDMQRELSKERSEAERNLLEMRNEFEVTAKDLKRHQREGNNLVTKVFLLENAKEKLEQELNEKERKMTITLESFTEERSRLSEKIRDLRISLEEEVRRRLDLEEKMQQIVKISVTEKEKDQLKATLEVPCLDQDAQVRFFLSCSKRTKCCPLLITCHHLYI